MGHAGLPQSPAEGEESRRVAGVDVEDGREVTVATRYGVEGSPYEPVQTGQVAHGRRVDQAYALDLRRDAGVDRRVGECLASGGRAALQVVQGTRDTLGHVHAGMRHLFDERADPKRTGQILAVTG